MTIIAADDLPGLDRVPVWFNDPANWWGPFGLVARIREHVVYSVVVVLIAIAIALPLGLLIGHTGRGVAAVVGLANALRAIPTLGAVILLSTYLSPHIHSTSKIPLLVDRGGLPYFVPVVIVLVLLAVPAILSNTYAGVQNVDPEARDAARGLGMTGWQVLRQVELPCAMPLILSGIRSAALQVIATVAVAAYLPFLGGLGRYIADGAGQLNDLQSGYPAMLCAGLVVAVLAVAIDGLLNLLNRVAVPEGLRMRTDRGRTRPVDLSGTTSVPGADKAATGI